MIRPLIILPLLLIAYVVTPGEALSQAPNMKKYAESMRSMEADKASGNKGSAAKKRDANRRDQEREEATRMRKSAQPAAQPKTAPEKAASFEPFKTKPLTLLAVLDSDGDGKLSGAEIDFATDQLLRLDANDDGQIDPDELPGSKQEQAVAVPTEFDAKYSGPGEQIYKTLSGFDKNADGVLTRSEIKADYRGVFRTIDTDQNRSISPSELLEYVKTQ